MGVTGSRGAGGPLWVLMAPLSLMQKAMSPLVRGTRLWVPVLSTAAGMATASPSSRYGHGMGIQ